MNFITKGGYITIGGYNDSLISSNSQIQYTEYEGTDKYWIKLKSMTVIRHNNIGK